MSINYERPRSAAGAFDAADLCARAGDYERAEGALLEALSMVRKGDGAGLDEETVKAKLDEVQARKGSGR
jgi:hypothetical protein